MRMRDRPPSLPEVMSGGYLINRASPQAAGLMLWLPMDEGGGSVAWDKAGRFHNGTMSGSPTPAIDVAGRSWYFDGTNTDQVAVADHVDIRPTGVFSATCWFNNASDINGNSQYMLSKGGWYGEAAGWGLMLDATNGGYDDQVCARVNQGGTGGTIGGDVAGNPHVGTNVWVHAGLTFDGTTWRMYVNGAEYGTAIVTGTAANSGYGLQIGTETIVSRQFNGWIRDVRIYERCLSRTEMWQLYDPRTRYDLWMPTRRRMSMAAVAAAGGTTGRRTLYNRAGSRGVQYA